MFAWINAISRQSREVEYLQSEIKELRERIQMIELHQKNDWASTRAGFEHLGLRYRDTQILNPGWEEIKNPAEEDQGGADRLTGREGKR